MFTGQIKAFHDVWFIGDDFLTEIYHTFLRMRDEAVKSQCRPPYVFEQYNVACFTPNPQTLLKDVLARLINCLIKALNDAVKLPRLIVIIPEEDLLQFISAPGYSVKKLSHEALTWLFNQVDRALDAKCDNLYNRKLGAVAFDTKIIWVQMINRINGYSKTLANRKVFNEVLANLVRNKTEHYLIDIDDEMADRSLLDSANRLNGYGRVHYFAEIDRKIEQFDKHRINLKPAQRSPHSNRLKWRMLTTTYLPYMPAALHDHHLTRQYTTVNGCMR